jgi:hypothetical protein
MKHPFLALMVNNTSSRMQRVISTHQAGGSLIVRQTDLAPNLLGTPLLLLGELIMLHKFISMVVVGKTILHQSLHMIT